MSRQHKYYHSSRTRRIVTGLRACFLRLGPDCTVSAFQGGPGVHAGRVLRDEHMGPALRDVVLKGGLFGHGKGQGEKLLRALESLRGRRSGAPVPNDAAWDAVRSVQRSWLRCGCLVRFWECGLTCGVLLPARKADWATLASMLTPRRSTPVQPRARTVADCLWLAERMVRPMLEDNGSVWRRLWFEPPWFVRSAVMEDQVVMHSSLVRLLQAFVRLSWDFGVEAVVALVERYLQVEVTEGIAAHLRPRLTVACLAAAATAAPRDIPPTHVATTTTQHPPAPPPPPPPLHRPPEQWMDLVSQRLSFCGLLPAGFGSNLLEQIICNGATMPAVQWLVQRAGVRITRRGLLCAVADSGRVDVLEWLHAQRPTMLPVCTAEDRSVSAATTTRHAFDAPAKQEEADKRAGSSNTIEVAALCTAVNTAAGNGFLGILRWLEPRGALHVVEGWAMEGALRRGFYPVVEYLMSNAPLADGLGTRCLPIAAQSGRVDIVECLLRHCPRAAETLASSAAVPAAVRFGHTQVLRFLHTKHPRLVRAALGQRTLAVGAAASSRVGLLEFLLDHCGVEATQTVLDAATRQHPCEIGVCKVLVARNPDLHLDQDAMVNAAGRNDLRLLEWAHARGSDITDNVVHSAESGYAEDVLRWLHRVRGHTSYTHAPPLDAVRRFSPEFLRWLLGVVPPPDDKLSARHLLQSAVVHGDRCTVECMQRFLSACQPVSFTSEYVDKASLMLAALKNRADVLRIVAEHGYPLDDSRLLTSACIGGAVDSIRYLQREHGLSFTTDDLTVAVAAGRGNVVQLVLGEGSVQEDESTLAALADTCSLPVLNAWVQHGRPVPASIQHALFNNACTHGKVAFAHVVHSRYDPKPDAEQLLLRAVDRCDLELMKFLHEHCGFTLTAAVQHRVREMVELTDPNREPDVTLCTIGRGSACINPVVMTRMRKYVDARAPSQSLWRRLTGVMTRVTGNKYSSSTS